VVHHEGQLVFQDVDEGIEGVLDLALERLFAIDLEAPDR